MQLRPSGIVFGSVKLTLIDKKNGRVKIGGTMEGRSNYIDEYNFEIKPNDWSSMRNFGKRALRNAGTLAGNALAWRGEAFYIFGYNNSVQIKK